MAIDLKLKFTAAFLDAMGTCLSTLGASPPGDTSAQNGHVTGQGVWCCFTRGMTSAVAALKTCSLGMVQLQMTTEGMACGGPSLIVTTQVTQEQDQQDQQYLLTHQLPSMARQMTSMLCMQPMQQHLGHACWTFPMSCQQTAFTCVV